MTHDKKLEYIKTLIGVSDDSKDAELSVYLELAGQEILSWKYSLVGIPECDAVPFEDEVTQINACIAGFGHKGAPDELMHNENGISRTWKHEDMVAYVRANVIAYAGVH